MRRGKRSTTQGQPRGQIVDAVSIRKCPAEVDERDTGTLGKARSRVSITRTLRLWLSAIPGLRCWSGSRVKTPTGVATALARQVKQLPKGLMSSLTWDRGTELLHRDPHGGDLYVFRGKSGKLIKVLWHDGIGMSLYLKRLERGRFVWLQTSDGAVVITSAQLGYLLEGIDWRNPVHSWRPSAAG
jgi:transposase